MKACRRAKVFDASGVVRIDKAACLAATAAFFVLLPGWRAVPVHECKGKLGLPVANVCLAFFPVSAGVAYRNVLAGLAFVAGAADVGGGLRGHGVLIRQGRGLFKP